APLVKGRNLICAGSEHGRRGAVYLHAWGLAGWTRSAGDGMRFGSWLRSSLCAASLFIALLCSPARAQTVTVPEAASPTPIPLVPVAPASPTPASPTPASPMVAAPAPSAPTQAPPAPLVDPPEQARGLSCLTGGMLAAAGTWGFI